MMELDEDFPSFLLDLSQELSDILENGDSKCDGFYNNQFLSPIASSAPVPQGEDIEEISNLHKFSSAIHNEWLAMGAKTAVSPIVRPMSSDSDDDFRQEATAVLDENNTSALFNDIEEGVSVYCTPQKSRTMPQDESSRIIHGFTPMTLSQLLAEEDSVHDSGIQDLLKLLHQNNRSHRDPRNPDLPPMSALSSLSLSPDLRTRRKSHDFFSSAFTQSSNTSFDGSEGAGGAGGATSLSHLVDGEGSLFSQEAVGQRILDVFSTDKKEFLSTESLRKNWDMEEVSDFEVDDCDIGTIQPCPSPSPSPSPASTAVATGVVDVDVDVDMDVLRYSERYRESLDLPSPLPSSSSSPSVVEGGDSSAFSSDWSHEVLEEAGRQAAREYKRAQSLAPPSSHPLSPSPTPFSRPSLSEGASSPLPDIFPAVFDERIRADFSLWQSGAKLTGEGLKESYAGFFNGLPTTSPHLFQTLCVMECVVRPDVELKRIMAAVLRGSHGLGCRFQLAKRSHAILARGGSIYDAPASTPSPGLPSLPSLPYPSFSAQTQEILEEPWDCIEAQVCISKELRQRVLVCVVLRSSIGSSIRASAPYRPAATTGGHAPFAPMIPIAQVFSTIQSLLVSSRLCLSSLYNAPPSSVCPGGRLDGHFEAQVQTLFREGMWSSLHEAFHAMDEHASQVEAASTAFEQTMESMYRQHQVMDSMKRLHLDQLKLDDLLTPSPSPMSCGVGEGKGGASTPGREEIQEEGRDSYVPSVLFLGTGRSVCDTTPLHSRRRSSSNDLEDLDFPDGMARCLHIVTNHFNRLQAKFDFEFATRLQRKHDSTFSVIDRMVAFRHSLLKTLANNATAKSSVLTKAYCSSMSEAAIGNASSSSNKRTTGSSSSRSWLSPKSSSNTAPISPSPTIPSRWQGFSFLRGSPVVPSPSEGTGTGGEVRGGRKRPSMLGMFRPTSEQARDTAERVEQRLAAFRRAMDDDGRIVNIVATHPSSPLTPHMRLSRSDGFKAPASSSVEEAQDNDVVLYFCSCVVGGVPGALYVTQRHVAVASGWLWATGGFSLSGLGSSSLHREVFPLSSLDAVAMQAPHASYLVAAPNTLKLSFRVESLGAGPGTRREGKREGQKREISIMPLLVEAGRLKTVITDAVAVFV